MSKAFYVKRLLKRFRPHKEEGLAKQLAFWLLSLIVGGGLLGLILLFGGFAVLSIGLPDVTDLDKLTAAESTEIYDQDNELLYTIHGEENREQVEYDEISPHIINATVAIEDDQFWNHKGYDIYALGKAVLSQLGVVPTPRGGSTITQQYVKNTFLSSERTYTRKIKELILSMRLESAFEKQDILGLYLNRIPYGNNAYGVQKAAEIYFDKDAKDLSLGESAILAALPQAPTRYNPFGNNKYSHLIIEFTEKELKKRTIESELDLELDEYARGLLGQHVELGNGEKIYIQGRSDLVLKRMFELGTITKEQRQKALNEIQNIEFNKYKTSIVHPHFVLDIKQQLEENYGKDIVEQGGLKVYTTIDPELQEYAEKIALEKGEENEKRFNANNVAVLTVNAKTGAILAMVGSRDYFNEEIDGNVNVIYRPRQPGSSFKPIVYAQAFYNGYAPANSIYDVPTKVGNDKPENYDGKWQGQISMKRALGQSRNIPAIKAYFLAGQQDPIIDLAELMGITTLKKSHSYGYPLALGAGEVPLSEMVTAYSTFANNGKRPTLFNIKKIENTNGDLILEHEEEQMPEVVDPQIAYLINYSLSSQEDSVGPRLFVKGKINAGKTGTSTKENKKESGKKEVRPSDAWTIGYTPTIVTGVWTGNTDGTGMGYNANGYDTASPIYNAVMTKALRNMPTEPFPVPEGIQLIPVSKASGKLAGKNTPESMIVSEPFSEISIPKEVENQFFTVKIDKISGLLATEYTPEDAVIEATYQNHEPIAPLFNWRNEIIEYFKYLENKPINEEDADETTPKPPQADGEIRYGQPPTEYDNIHTAQTAKNKPSISIITPSSKSSLPHGNVEIEVNVNGGNEIDQVEFYLDDDKKFFTNTAPYKGFINISKFLKDGSNHLIVAKVIDKLGYSDQSAIEIRIQGNEPTKKSETPTE